VICHPDRFPVREVVRLLGVLRVWRLFRVVSTVVDHERASHEESKTLLDLERAVRF
jgi:hypothetical protein